MTRSLTTTSLLFAILAAACGEIQSLGDDDPMPDADPGPVAPRLASSSPADGATGVAADAAIVLTFSAPMDVTSVETAFYAPSLGDVTLAWDPARTALTITPHAPLAYAEGVGDDPALVDALAYEVVIGSAARSEAGLNLEENIRIEFATLKRMSTSFDPDPALTRTVLGDGGVLAEGLDLAVGDTAANVPARALVTFDVSALPAGATVESAKLATRQLQVVGAPYTIDSNVMAYHVSYGTAPDGYAAPAMSSAGAFAQLGTVVIQLPVAAKLQDDLDQRTARAGRSQFRLQYDSGHNNNNTPDYTVFGLGLMELEVVYLAP